MDNCIDHNGATMLSPAGLVKNLINHYVEAQDWTRVTKLYEELVKQENTADNWVKLAQLYAQQGENDKAIEAAQKVGDLDKSYQPYVAQFINGLSGQ
jgi:lipopolysaccharide biosynthesis regulator YciM